MSLILTSPLPEKGVAIPIYGTFTGHKAVPLWAFSHNSLSHKLRFFEAEVELKVMKTHRRAWSDVESVDARILFKKPQLTLNFRDTPWNFTAVTVLERTLHETLEFLDGKGLVLTPRARQLLESGAA